MKLEYFISLSISLLYANSINRPKEKMQPNEFHVYTFALEFLVIKFQNRKI